LKSQTISFLHKQFLEDWAVLPFSKGSSINMLHKFTSRRSQNRKSKRSSTSSLRGVTRRPSFEPLETRNLLSVTLSPIPAQTLTAGTPLVLPLASTGTTNPVSYTVSVNNSNMTAAVPSGNTFLKLHVEDTADGINGDMIFELFNDLAPNTVAKITTLVNSNYYNGLTFHRIIEDFMIQGGDPKGDGTGGPTTKFDDEFNVNLQFNSPGLLAMANSGSDTNGSQFFITTEQTRWLDFKHTIFGKIVQGQNILDLLNKVPTDSSDKPTHTVTITTASIVTDNLDGVVRLSAPSTPTSGTSVVTVTAKDTVTNETSVQTINVTIGADIDPSTGAVSNARPFLKPISPIQVTYNTPYTFGLSNFATDVENDAIYYDAVVSPSNPNLTISVDHTTGNITLSPYSSSLTPLAPGVYSILVKVGSSSNASSFDTQLVPVYVNPAAPTIQLLADSDTGSSNSDKVTSLNNTTGKTLVFQVGGVALGATVQIYSDGTLIGETTTAATSTSFTITTNGSVTLTDGAHAITVKQTMKNKAVNVGNLSTTTDLASVASTALTLNVDTIQPVFSFTPIKTASVGIAYNCPVSVSGETAGSVTYQLTQSPSGMTYDSSKGLITWTPATGQTGPVDVKLKATDKAGNTKEISFQIAMVAPNSSPVLQPASPSLGNTNEDTQKLISLSSFINHGTGSTSITDADSTTVVGGIALTSLTGHGLWEYTLDGTNFVTILAVSESSALLLPQNASLRYTPDGKNGETVAIIYRAWDTTAGDQGGRMDISQATLVGGNTAFSAATDTATLTVNSLNNAPELQQASPSMGTADIHSPKVINVNGVFINNGTSTTIITDVDSDSATNLGGIAIYGVTGNGTWEYSLDGTTFTAIGTVSNTSALLLPKSAKLRYTPVGSADESPTISYRAWDATSGTSGNKVDLSATGATGGRTAFSAASDTATLTVTDVNDAPVLTPANPSLGTTTEDTAMTISLTDTFINHGTGTTTIEDADSIAVKGGIAITGMTGSGKWEYSLDGTTYTTISSVSDASALLLPKTATLRYTPAGANAETATITYRAWDTTSGTAGSRVNLSQSSSYGDITAFSTAKDTASLTVTSVNDAPVLVPAHPSLGTIVPGASKTISLTSSFINYNSGSTTITDVDSNSILGGLALIGISGSGTWEYSLDGTTFISVGTISASSALLLPKTASLRYTAGNSLTDSPTITYRAWDTTDGTSGSKVDLSATSATGNATAYSAATDTATLTVAGGSISGYVYVDVNNDGLRTVSGGGTHYCLPGVPVKLLLKDNSGNWNEVAGISPVMTGADGSYHFNNLVAGTYRVQEVQPSNYLDGKETAGQVNGTTKGTTGSDTIDITIAGGENGTEYNFGELGLRPEKITLRMFLASSPIDGGSIAQFNIAPIIDLSAAQSGTGYSTTVNTNGSAVAIAASDATIADSDSSMLSSMTATLSSALDGSSEVLAADVSNTSITSSYANGVLTLSGTASVSDYQKVLRTITYKNTATAPHAGVRTINVVVSDGIASSLAAISSITVAAGPAGYSIAANDSLINAAEAASTGFTFTGATVGSTYKYTVSSSGGSATVTGTGTITSATQAITGINVSSLLDGTLTYSVTLTDKTGSVGTVVNATATLDKSVPTNYSIMANDPFLNATKAASTGFTFAGAEIGATYAYTITSSGGTATVTGTGTITSATQAITGINVSSLLDGTLVFSVTLTDPAGNVGTAKTAPASLDRVAPTDYSITANDSLINGTEAANTGFTFAGAEIGATYSYTVTSDGGDASVTGSGSITSATQQITNINVSSLPNGHLTYKVKLTDSSGNVGAEVTATATLDKPAPTGYTITANESKISATEATSTGFTFAGAEVNATYTYTVTSSGGSGTAPVTGTGTINIANQQINNIDVSGLPAGTLTFSVTLTDPAGNVGTAATATAILDKTAPTGFTITPNDAQINAAKAASTGFTFAGAEEGATYTCTITSAGGTGSVTKSGTITSATQEITGIDVSSLPDGVLTFSVTLTDQAGNVSTAVTSPATLDKTAPTGYSITVNDKLIGALESGNFGFTITGAELNTSFTYTITSDGGGNPLTNSGTITLATQPVTGIDVSSLPNGNLTISVTLRDTAGNTGTAVTDTAKLDMAAPAGYSITAKDAQINATKAANTGFTFTGAEVGATYTYTITSTGGGNSLTDHGTITSADQQITGIDVSSLLDGTLTFSVKITDLAGNIGPAVTATANLDRVAPAGYSIAAKDAQINATKAPNTGFTFTGAEVGSTYSCIVKDSAGTELQEIPGTITSADQQITGIDVSSLVDGTLTFTVKITDLAGNVGPAVTATANLDRVAPAGYSITAGPSLLPLGNEITNIIFANAEIGTTYNLVISTDGGIETLPFSNSITAIDQVIDSLDVTALSGGTLTYSVTLTDAAGNTGIVATSSIIKAIAGSQAAIDNALSQTENWLSI
jgi:cyclophilin family peptidyl-prolyl cis-trans isomerase